MSKLDDIKARVKRQSAHEQLIESVITNVNNDVNVNVDVYIKNRPKRKKFEELHTRQTFYIENELIELLGQIAGNEKGEKTRIVNDALRVYLKNGSRERMDDGR